MVYDGSDEVVTPWWSAEPVSISAGDELIVFSTYRGLMIEEIRKSL
jgi:hypothetical protein